MTALPWETRGARLHLPRDLQVAYAVGRMGVAVAAHLGPLFYGSHNTARVGFHRLTTLGLLRTFERTDPSKPAWYALAPEAASWVAEGMGCEEEELRVVTGIRRMNLAALDLRNRLWGSMALAARASGGRVDLVLVRPEWELRRLKPEGVHVVPDMQAVFVDRAASPEREAVWMVELDSSTERKAVIKAKAEAYRSVRGGGALFGARDWRVLFVVPGPRRARSVSAAVTEGGAGAFTYVAVCKALMDGHALDTVLHRACDLAASKEAVPSASLLGEGEPDPDQRARSAADRGLPVISGGMV